MTNSLGQAVPKKAIRNWRDFFMLGPVSLTVAIVGLLAIWALISSVIPNPDRYLPSPLAVVLSSVDMLQKGVLPS